jgi:hypothetical protein
MPGPYHQAEVRRHLMSELTQQERLDVAVQEVVLVERRADAIARVDAPELSKAEAELQVYTARLDALGALDELRKRARPSSRPDTWLAEWVGISVVAMRRAVAAALTEAGLDATAWAEPVDPT